MMRVQALYRRSRVVTCLLYFFFAMSQIGNAISTVDTFVSSVGNTDYEGSSRIQLLSGVLVCKLTYSTSLWAFISFIITTISFELVAVSLALYRLVTQHRVLELRPSSLWASNDLFHLVAQENLIYFCASAACLIIVGLQNTNGYTEMSTALIGLRLVLETFWLTMFGPYLILNIRRHDADRINGRFFLVNHSVSEIAFAPGRPS